MVPQEFCVFEMQFEMTGVRVENGPSPAGSHSEGVVLTKPAKECHGHRAQLCYFSRSRVVGRQSATNNSWLHFQKLMGAHYTVTSKDAPSL